MSTAGAADEVAADTKADEADKATVVVTGYHPRAARPPTRQVRGSPPDMNGVRLKSASGSLRESDLIPMNKLLVKQACQRQ